MILTIGSNSLSRQCTSSVSLSVHLTIYNINVLRRSISVSKSDDLSDQFTSSVYLVDLSDQFTSSVYLVSLSHQFTSSVYLCYSISSVYFIALFMSVYLISV